jgi:hypothetical protein
MALRHQPGPVSPRNAHGSPYACRLSKVSPEQLWIVSREMRQAFTDLIKQLTTLCNCNCDGSSSALYSPRDLKPSPKPAPFDPLEFLLLKGAPSFTELPLPKGYDPADTSYDPADTKRAADVVNGKDPANLYRRLFGSEWHRHTSPTQKNAGFRLFTLRAKRDSLKEALDTHFLTRMIGDQGKCFLNLVSKISQSDTDDSLANSITDQKKRIEDDKNKFNIKYAPLYCQLPSSSADRDMNQDLYKTTLYVLKLRTALAKTADTSTLAPTQNEGLKRLNRWLCRLNLLAAYSSIPNNFFPQASSPNKQNNNFVAGIRDTVNEAKTFSSASLGLDPFEMYMLKSLEEYLKKPGIQ